MNVTVYVYVLEDEKLYARTISLTFLGQLNIDLWQALG